MNIWDELLKVYNMPGIPDEAMSIIGDVMLAWSEGQEGDTISRKAAIDKFVKLGDYYEGRDEVKRGIHQCIAATYELPAAQPNMSEAYSKAVFTWLMDYQIRAAELKGRYTPYEVLSWVINDWRKENE